MSTRTIWLLYILLYVLSVPWYWPAAAADVIIAGFPLWALASLGCYVAAALLTVWIIEPLWRREAGGEEAER